MKATSAIKSLRTLKTLQVMTIALAMTAIGSVQAFAEKRIALVIGNSDYENTVYLENPRNDAVSLSDILRSLDFEVIERTDLRHKDMQATLLEYSNLLRGADVGLFFYAGHGLQVDGRNYLVPVDAELSSEVDLAFETTELDVVMRILQRQTRTGLVFLDACRNNPLAGNLSGAGGSNRSAAVGSGLARVDSGVGMLITFATQPGNVALDGFGDHSPFTEALLEYIDTPGVDVAQMLRRVRDNVITATNGKQVPWNNSSLTEDFYFSPEVEEEPVQVAAAPTAPQSTAQNADGSAARAPAGQSNVAIELAFWQSIVNSNDPAVFEAYLAQFPDGSFSSLARLRLKSLQGSQVAAAPKVQAQETVQQPKPKVEPQVQAQAAQPEKPVAATQPVVTTQQAASKPAASSETQVAALPAPTVSKPNFNYRVQQLEEVHYARKVSNVRAGPGTSYDTVSRLNLDQQVSVTGKVLGQNWYRIALASGGEGFVYGTLISPEPPAQPVPLETASQATAPQTAEVEPVANTATDTAKALRDEQRYWDGVRNSRNPKDYERYLMLYGEDGLFSAEARQRSANLTSQKNAQVAAAAKANTTTASSDQAQKAASNTATRTAAATPSSGNTVTSAPTDVTKAPEQPATEPEQTAALTPANDALPSAKYDGDWEGKASTRFGTQCKSGYNIKLNIGDARITGTMSRSSEHYGMTGDVDKAGYIQNLEGFSRVKVILTVESATKDEIEGTWDMGSKSDYGGSPCRGVFSITRAGS